jgi:drug/metabolite transporter (DMT)-like permease
MSDMVAVIHTDSERHRVALLVGLVLMVTWGANFTVQKHVYATLSAGGFLFARYLVLSGCAVALLCHRYGNRWPRPTLAEWRELIGASLIGQVVHVALVTYGIDMSTAFSSSLIVACGPVFTLIILRLLGIEKLSRGQVLGVAIAFVGVLLFSSEKLMQANWTASGGDLMLLVAAALFSLYTVWAKPLMERHGTVVVICYVTLIGTPPMLLIGSHGARSVDWLNVAPSVWAGFAWSVVAVSFFGWMAWVNSVRGVARSAPLLYLMPPVAGLIAWFASGEAFGVAKLAGAAIALSGVAVAQLASHRARLPELLGGSN